MLNRINIQNFCIMKKGITLILLLISTIISAQKINLDWVNQIKGDSSCHGKKIVVDSDGFIYSFGLFSGTIDFDPNTTTDNLTSVGKNSFYITKSNQSGDIIWTKQITNISSNSSTFHYLSSILPDNKGNLIVTGIFNDSLDIFPGNNSHSLTSSGTTDKLDLYFLKLNSSGDLLWTKQIHNAGVYLSLNVLEIDTSGAIYTLGNFRDTADFDPGNNIHNLTSTTAKPHRFILKLKNIHPLLEFSQRIENPKVQILIKQHDLNASTIDNKKMK